MLRPYDKILLILVFGIVGATIIPVIPVASAQTQVGQTTDSPARQLISDLPFKTSGAKFSQACAQALAAGLGLGGSSVWKSVESTDCTVAVLAYPGFSVQPAKGQTVKLALQSAPLSTVCDISLGGACSITSSSGTVYPQWWGAKCGSADSTASVQAALNNAANTPTVMFTCQFSISNTVYVPFSAGGTILRSNSTVFGGPPAGLIAVAGSPEFQMLRIYAYGVELENLYINCNHVAGTGLVLANAAESVVNSLQSTQCKGDGIQVNSGATPATTITLALPAASKPGAKVEVEQATGPGITLGVYPCTEEWLEYGSSRQELFEFGAKGNELTQTFPKVSLYAHPAGSAIQCAGNNDNIILTNLNSSYNTGWGLRIGAGADQNDITIIQPQMYNNTSGGALLSGSGGTVLGGHFEANKGGPAVQLGNSEGGTGPNGLVASNWTVTPAGDNEANGVNAVVEVCGDANLITYRNPGQYVPGGPETCPAFPRGTNTSAFGPTLDGNGYAEFSTKTLNGLITFSPGSTGGMIKFYNSAGILTNTYGLGDTADPSGVAAPFYTTNSITAYQTANFNVKETAASANNALVVTLTDPTGKPVTLADGLRLTFRITHSLQVGRNTLNFNGHDAHVSRASNGGTLASSLASGAIIDVVYSNANAAWFLMSQ